MERADAWGTSTREAAGDNALDTHNLRSSKEVLLEVDEPWHDAADNDVDTWESRGP